jgi:chromosome segregation ATPase
MQPPHAALAASQLQPAAAALASLVSAACSHISDQHAELDSLRQQLGASQAEGQSKPGGSSSASETIMYLKAQLQGARDASKRAYQEVREVQGQLEEAEAGAAGQQALRRRAEEAEQKLQETRAQLQLLPGLQQCVAEAQGRLSEQQQELLGLKRKVAEAEGQLRQKQSQLEASEQRHAAHKQRLADIKQQMASLKEQQQRATGKEGCAKAPGQAAGPGLMPSVEQQASAQDPQAAAAAAAAAASDAVQTDQQQGEGVAGDALALQQLAQLQQRCVALQQQARQA